MPPALLPRLPRFETEPVPEGRSNEPGRLPPLFAAELPVKPRLPLNPVLPRELLLKKRCELDGTLRRELGFALRPDGLKLS